MRRTLIVALLVLAASIAVCVCGSAMVNHTLNDAGRLRQEAMRRAELGDSDAALDAARSLAALWQSRSRVMELLTSHDALSEVQGGIEDAALCLEDGDRLEFQRAMTGVGVALERIRITEAARLMNLF